jgi:hypothetical protein
MKPGGAIRRVWAWRKRSGWPVLLALLAITVLDDARDEFLTIYYAYDFLPDDAPGVVHFLYSHGEHLLLALAFVLWLLGRQRAFRVCQMVLLGLVTFFLAMDVTFLIITLPTRANETGAFALLWDAFLVWTANVLIFAAWYWTVDRWSPGALTSDLSAPRDLWFPEQDRAILGGEHWRPGFIDYLFLAFNTSTAFSVTHTQFVSPRTKGLMMLQAITSLIIVVMLAARVVNIIA